MSETKKELEGSILVFTKKESIGWSFYIEKENDTEFEFSFEAYQMLAKLFTDALQTIQRDPSAWPSKMLEKINKQKWDIEKMIEQNGNLNSLLAFFEDGGHPVQEFKNLKEQNQRLVKEIAELRLRYEVETALKNSEAK